MSYINIILVALLLLKYGYFVWHIYLAKAKVNSSTETAIFPPTYAFPVIVAKPSLSSKPTRLISITKSSPGVTGDFHLQNMNK